MRGFRLLCVCSACAGYGLRAPTSIQSLHVDPVDDSQRRKQSVDAGAKSLASRLGPLAALLLTLQPAAVAFNPVSFGINRVASNPPFAGPHRATLLARYNQHISRIASNPTFARSYLAGLHTSTRFARYNQRIMKPQCMLANKNNMQVLVTGGCGYIGSHTIITLLESGYDVTVVDSLVNSSPESLRRVTELVGCDPSRVKFFEVDLCNHDGLEEVFRKSPRFSACIHFAGLKAVGESARLPLLYYEKNLGGTINLLKMMDKYGCPNIVFSSSATVYGSEAPPLTEASKVGVGITNAYGRTKFMIEEILRDFKQSKSLSKDEEDEWGIVILRYFNPVGAHPSGVIGEDPNGIPNNLMPFVAQVAVGRREKLTIFGGDYATPDGTGVRDYIHVVDLAEGHAAALNYLEKKGAGFYTFNLGTGRGYSVLDMVKAMSKACGHEIKYEMGPRRPGDLAEIYADTAFAEKELGWKAFRTQEDMCNDIWRWQKSNPNGFVAAPE